MTEVMLDIVGIYKVELFTGGTSLTYVLEPVLRALQYLFRLRVIVVAIKRVIFVLSYRYRSFWKFLDVSFLLLSIWSSILLISTWCTPFKVLNTVIIPDKVLVVDLSVFFWIRIRDEV